MSKTFSGLISFTALMLLFSGCMSAPKKYTEAEIAAMPPSGQISNGIRVVKMTAKQFEYIPEPVVVISGESVELDITSIDVTHGFDLPSYKINMELKPKETEVVTFKAGEKGVYPFYCSVFCGLGHGDMRGNLIVLPVTN